MVAYIILQAHATYVALKIALKVQDNASNMTFLTFLHAGTGLCTSYNTFTYFKYSFYKCLELNRYIRYQVLHTLFVSICMAVLTIYVLSLSVNIANS